MTLYGGLSQNTRTPTASEIECSNPLTPCLLPTNLAGDPPNLHQVVAHTAELGLRGKIPAVAGAAGEVTGIGAPGIPPNGVTNGPGVDNRFLSPAAPFEAFGGVRITF